ncbi:hypothetical protein [Phaeobacter gallaeciensis]|uniref:hypothetical protein n=1 Tax=Phaeobacter gallaeciensis TaxID=60890 RepID=UPI00237EF35C|nr:hypothetical protein [Phaeobacter gallaeciensis]MDE4061909.1 hypothetical protein [Phaeobacter gallaeciensis]MDE4124903.1 hypothetical protein [Phaeobacter gallaeciensis]MDE4129375.1 hypothetical protein [Phaeobacter gallaeciensis]
MRNLIPLVAAFAATVVPTFGMAQSVLERVLGQIEATTNLAPVNVVYANIAETNFSEQLVQGPEIPVTLEYAPPSTILWDLDGDGYIRARDIGSTFTRGDGTELGDVLDGLSIDSITVNLDGSLTIVAPDAEDDIVIEMQEAGGQYYGDEFNGGGPETLYPKPDGLVVAIARYDSIMGEFFEYVLSTPEDVALREYLEAVTRNETFLVPYSHTIDGSITNIITGITDATAIATASTATATEFTLPTINFGDMATTALGAVNTSDITLGVNSAVDEAETVYTLAISAALSQIGGSVDTGAIFINVASNMSAVDGSITNVMSQVNGSIGILSTTALGAVNTGNIVSGVDAAVQGIVGMNGQASF